MTRYQKGKTYLDFTDARDSKRQWHQLCHMQVCTSHQTDNHASTPPFSFLQARCPSCRPTNSVKALPQLTLNPNRHLPLIGPLQYPKAWFPAKRNARIACNATKILRYNLTRVLLCRSTEGKVCTHKPTNQTVQPSCQHVSHRGHDTKVDTDGRHYTDDVR